MGTASQCLDPSLMNQPPSSWGNSFSQLFVTNQIISPKMQSQMHDGPQTCSHRTFERRHMSYSAWAPLEWSAGPQNSASKLLSTGVSIGSGSPWSNSKFAGSSSIKLVAWRGVVVVAGPKVEWDTFQCFFTPSFSLEVAHALHIAAWNLKGTVVPASTLSLWNVLRHLIDTR